MFHTGPLLPNYEDSFAADADTCSSSVISDLSCVSSSSISQDPLLLISFSLSSSFSFSSCCWKTMALKWGCLTFVQSLFPLCVFSKRYKKEDERAKKKLFSMRLLLYLSACWGFLTADSRSISTPVFNLLVCNLRTCQFLYLLPNCSTCLVLLPVPKVELAGCFITCVCFVCREYYAKKLLNWFLWDGGRTVRERTH